MRILLPLLCFVLFSSVLFSVSAQNVYNWHSQGGDGEWSNSTQWSQPGFPNATNAVAVVDVDFSIGTIDVDSSVTVSKLVVGPGCARLQINESPSGSVRLTVETNPLDSSEVTITGTLLNEPIAISVGDPYVVGRSVVVTARAELGGEVKQFVLSRPSTTSGWFYGSFDTMQGPACPQLATTICLTGPQDIIVSYVSPLTGETHNASFAPACADFSDFTVPQIEWLLIADAARHNFDKLTDLKNRLTSVQSTLNSRSYADNVNYYKTVAEESFILGSSCFENYCASTAELAHKLTMDGGQVDDHQRAPLARIDSQIEY